MSGKEERIRIDRKFNILVHISRIRRHKEQFRYHELFFLFWLGFNLYCDKGGRIRWNDIEMIRKSIRIRISLIKNRLFLEKI
mmetsp:Transcript_42804/g.51400  ORF Transcript_42804/g.51400 Transcript_42804/m.51400 type:complete len:82 (-) Transcript_42804:86-331(-)